MTSIKEKKLKAQQEIQDAKIQKKYLLTGRNSY